MEDADIVITGSAYIIDNVDTDAVYVNSSYPVVSVDEPETYSGINAIYID